MSYLDTLRFHFAGKFLADPSTINNLPDNYNNASFKRSKKWRRGNNGGWWNPQGSHAFRLQNVTIKSAVKLDGNKARAASDSIYAYTLESRGRNPAKMVDLDPDQQLVSMIYGLRVALLDENGNMAFDGTLEATPFTDIWFRGASGSGDEAASATYQSILTIHSWGDLSSSKFLRQLHSASGDTLSVKFNLDGYSMNFLNPLHFATGRIVGTIGTAVSSQPKHFVIGRQFNSATDKPENPAFFNPVERINFCVAIHDEARKKIRLDLGNALPVNPAGGPVKNTGTLFLSARMQDGSVREIARIPYRKSDWYHSTAGIVEVPHNRQLSDQESELIKTSTMCIMKKQAGKQKVLIEELNGGSYVRADMFVGRMNPGDRLAIKFYASHLGTPFSGALIRFEMITPADTPEYPVSGLQFPSSLRTDRDGIAVLELTAFEPGNPRYFVNGMQREHIDGQVYRVAYKLEGSSSNNPSDFLSILVWNHFIPDDPVTWHGSMKQVFEQYGNLYPWMANFGPKLDLADYDQVCLQRTDIISVLSLPENDVHYMPVARDLSRSKKEAMLRWLEQVGPDGKPLRGTETPALDFVDATIKHEDIEDDSAENHVTAGGKTVAAEREKKAGRNIFNANK